MNNMKTRAVIASFVGMLRTLSKCEDRQVACVICTNDLSQVLSIGVNGAAKGQEPECLCHTNSKYSCIHAEANALIKLHELVPDKVMICSLQPCEQCASMIVNEPGGFSQVLYMEPWKSTEGLHILQKAGIETGRLYDDGVIITSTHLTAHTML